MCFAVRTITYFETSSLEQTSSMRYHGNQNGRADPEDEWQPPPDDLPSPAGPQEVPPEQPEPPGDLPEGVPPGPSEVPPAPLREASA